MKIKKQNKNFKTADNFLEEYKKFNTIKNNLKPWVEAFKIILVYVIIGGLWILLSDKAMRILFENHEGIEIYKGWLYVLVTGIIFYIIIMNKLKLFENAIITIFKAYEELSMTQEELMALNDELDEQNQKLESQKNALMISEQRYELAVEGANDGIWDWDLVNNNYIFSIKGKPTLGYAESDFESNVESWRNLIHPDDKCKTAVIEQYLKEGQNGIYENTFRIRSKSGDYRWILSRGKAVWNKEGIPVRIAGSHTDITQHMHLQEALRTQMELSEHIILDAPMLIMVVDSNLKIMQFNPYAEKATGYRKDELTGESCEYLKNLITDRLSIGEMLKKVLSGDYLNGIEITLQKKMGGYISVLWNNNILHDENGGVLGVVSIGVDITDRIIMESQLDSFAFYDKLTGLPNRTLFEKEVCEYIQKRQHNEKMAVIYLDVDDFKQINDTMGYAMGDSYIRHASKLLTSVIQSPNSIARMGEDEFAVLLTNVEDEQSIITMAGKLLEILRKPWIIGNQNYFVTYSIGIAIYPDHAADYGTLMRNANTAMHHFKDNGKNGFSIYKENMLEETLKYMQMRNLLAEAIEKEEFILYYQPQIDLKNGRIIGLETLIRWNHPIRGFISPMEFIPLAERTGQIEVIDKWVLKTACKQKSEWVKAGYLPVKIAVNLSGRMLMKDDVIQTVKDIINNCMINPGDLELEVTETALIKELDKATGILEELKQLGISIALDDFGTGYSSLTYLQKLPLDILKIDREFLRNVRNEDDEMYIYNAIIGMAHNMGLKVISEGVETNEQKSFLMKNSCDIGQGYYFDRPMPAEKVEQLYFLDKSTC